ncbi:sodium:solute symporter family protein [Pontiella sulfatireligans]|uniref:Osmoregulated proline transporter OpuE n=1 Tax=Pontiella sulfatireligans TaxID=2750658 RepID=A0A6C2UE51_9BACT|nr:sodium:solute symporter family protein [Pontiella sulfatireligans]VGO18450.1 Osmoregulated proline transporter OpuE [Pontiella sulfatireligans]
MSIWMIIIVVAYLGVIGYLGFRGFKSTKTATDYLLGGREAHPYVMAMSYGATFISTSAIIGFGGASAVFGMSLLWLPFLNIFLGIFIAFWLFGRRTRKMGLRLDAHTFPELLGRRFKSRFIQGAAGVIIFLFVPMYASAVLTGAAKYLAYQFSMNYNIALFVFSVIIALYVVMGGIKGVMYTDALQATIMLIGLSFLLYMTYHKLGGPTAAHQALTDMADQVPAKLQAAGHRGWTRMPQFGTPLWWTAVSTIIMGVGIGVLAQPQLAVRYMTVKSGKELNRAIPIGGVFILLTAGVAYIVGSLSNVFFQQTVGEISIAVAKGDVEQIIPMYLQAATPNWFSVLFMLTLMSAAMSTLSSQFHVMGTSIGRDLIEESLGRKSKNGGVLATRIGVLAGILVSVYLSYAIEIKFGKTGTAVVARGTAIFFGLCACAFLPMYVGALWSRGITKAGAIAGLIGGAASSLLWMLLIHEKASTALLLCNTFFGTRSLAIQTVEGKEVFLSSGPIIWAFVDPLLIGLPISILLTVLVSRFTKKITDEHLAHCGMMSE